MGSYTAALNDYVRQELGFESDLPYEVLNPKVLPWNYSDFENRYVDVAETLRKAMTTNPFLKVFIANGYFDLATPYFATIYTYYHLNLDPTIKDHISMGFYDAGHMMYNQISSLKKLKHDLVEFIHSSITIRIDKLITIIMGRSLLILPIIIAFLKIFKTP
jgi:carboxypeptidase C (cathepsin A)